MTKLATNLKLRDARSTTLQRQQHYVHEIPDTDSLQALQVRMERVVKAWNEFSQYQDDIELECPDADLPLQQEIRGTMEDIFIEVKGKLQSRILALTPINLEAQPQPDKSLKVKLPELHLPNFDGNFLEWQSFRDLYRSSIHMKTTLSDSQKLQYLKSCLRGEAAKIVQSIPVTDANYADAWKLLETRYQDKKALQKAQLRFLRTLPMIVSATPSLLREMSDAITESVRALKNLEAPVQHWDLILLDFLTEKLDPVTREKWEDLSQPKDVVTINEFCEFLIARSKILSISFEPNLCVSGPSKGQKYPNPKPIPKTVNTVSHASNPYPNCFLCQKESHPLFKCPKFLEMPVSDRSAFIRKQNRCFNCFMSGHSSQACRNPNTCRTCHHKHHTLLHFEKKPDVIDCNKQSVVATVTSATLFPNRPSSEMLLSTAIVNVHGVSGGLIACRSLLDSASGVSLISENIARRLGLTFKSCSAPLTGVGGAKSSSSSFVIVDVSSRFDPSYRVQVNALVLPKITDDLPNQPCDIRNWSHITKLQLADPKFNIPDTVHLLLDAGVFFDSMLLGKIEGPPGTAGAIATTFGWVLMGSYLPRGTMLPESYTSMSLQLENIVHKFWEVEFVPEVIHQPEEHSKCREHFERTFSRAYNGRFIVELPFKSDPTLLGDTLTIASKRFAYLEKRFTQDSNLRNEYVKFMREYSDLGHMVIVTEDCIDCFPRAYLPHHAVFKESSSTTKVRVVFDGSAKPESGLSLNQALMVGPTTQGDLFSIIVRFRTHPIALIADLEKMFRQIQVHPKHQDFQRVLWRESPEEPLKHYRLTTVTYGTTSAPFLSVACLRKLAELESSSFPLASAITLRDYYVDDLITGCNSPEEAISLSKELCLLAAKGGFSLRKWCSNSPIVQASFSSDKRGINPEFDFDSSTSMKTLGVLWNQDCDMFTFSVSHANHSRFTKRIILSEIARVFDPLGWLCPVTVRAKVLLKELWKKALGWDQSVPEDMLRLWLEYRQDLLNVKLIVIPRCIVSPTAIRYHLHGFCDASERAYCACIYLWTRDNVGNVQCNLIASKNSIAPMKTVSLPRLELCGAVLLCKLFNVVRDALHLPIQDFYAWSDSQVALAWIKSPSYKWKTYVANRVSKIQATIPSSNWNCVPTKENPSDLGTRGVSADSLSNSLLWWTGPTWLQGEDIPFSSDVEETVLETVCEKRHCILKVTVSTDLAWIERFSSLQTLIHVTAFMLRFTKGGMKGGNYPSNLLTVQETEYALTVLCRALQMFSFPDDYAALSKSLSLPTKSKLHNLHPFIDESGVLRVGGRLHKSNLPFERKHPIILPHHHHLITLLLRYYHLQYSHCGPTLLISSLHEKYWILGVRNSARLFVMKCIVCFRLKAQATEQLMGSLPTPRTAVSRPFTSTGVDYAGPIILRDKRGRGSKPQKAYIVLFVCLATHAIHLELATDLTTEMFIASLRRFVAIRAKPRSMYSDCGTNFKGADRELQELVQSRTFNETVSKSLVDEGIDWVFNPPGSPHFGGLWEAGVKSVKHHLRRVIGPNSFVYEEMFTILKQIEACLNSRPLTPKSSDPDDLEPLTPGHFLVSSSLKSLPDRDLISVPSNRCTRWQLVQKMVQSVWIRWQKEYLSRLQTRPKWWVKKEIRVGDLVVLKEPQQPLTWEMARIIKIFPGEDGVTRVVTLKTARGEKKRPVHKICILPFDTD